MALYDESHNLRPRNLFEEHKEKPFKDAISVARDRIAAVTSLLDDNAFADQYPANRVPFKFSKRYEIDLTSARHRDPTLPVPAANEGFEYFANIADLGNDLLPVNGNLFVNREGAFYLTHTDAFGYVSLSYETDPGFAGGTFVNPTPAAGIFDSALVQNGGALALNYFYSSPDYQDKPNISWDIRFRNKTTGRYLNTGRLPAQEVKDMRKDHVLRFDENTEIEPRLRVLECRMGDLLDDNQAYNAASFKGYLYVVFSGYKVLGV